MGKKLAQSISVTKPDVVIVGGGAGGIAVALHLIEQAKKGRILREIVIIEKRDILGPGLAFSTDCHGTILNMHSDTMGIYNENPQDYTQWRKSLEDGPFPSRVDYGKYLQERWTKATEEARALGIVIVAVQANATDIDRVGDSGYTVTLDNQTTLTAHAVVLALGNFTGSANGHLAGKPGYLANPWPTTQLSSIPPTAHVLVVGSRLSAVDTALYLSENGHQGPVTFMSRSGRLPRVQGDPTPNPRRYALHELAREVEGTGNPEENLLRLASALMDEISTATGGDWSWMVEKASPKEQLEADLAAAQEGRVRWQSILNGTAPVVERYWNALSATSQKLFMERFNSAWMTYRHAMPVKNAKRVLALLSKGQLRVVRGDNVAWEGNMFTARTSAGLVETPYVVEATGAESRLERVDSPLVRAALAKGLLAPHAAGGVVVDFHSLQADKGLYVMGSLTRGTHFYVSATDRVAAHASRIAKSLTCEPFAAALHVAVFVGGDLVSNIMASKLVPELLRAGHVPYIFLAPEQRRQKGAAAEVPELAFLESELLQEHVIPYFSGKGAEDARSPTVRQLAAMHGILVRPLPIRSFSGTMGKHRIDAGLSLGPGELPGADEYFSDGGRTLLQLHSEKLSSYRGVMAAARSGGGHFLYALREVRRVGTHVVDIRKHAVDQAKPALACMEDVHALGIEMAMGAVGKIARGEHLGAVSPVAEGDGGRPSKAEVDEYAAGIVQVLVDSFASTQKRDDFQSHILEVVREWSDRNYA
ncbi:pyridine nucleotide-disulfide oxidoreductase family protein [Cordyceps fumosorosea ARSEF 2679]|uniref:Pyridine nucleotide-disulfide oxidoreductase family protein n=1 Tax=Cordyceps fumosorosea (strain ARSEF 2679) TaxID=1081104 RepID=A0A162I6L9_CORFA|nr:pyridine nucleotide-disulfide oxidoreductase family protein [Cordyceps fumosorosea ARSEF 2679]OAA52995.1 pyridine nucleotide-disulfide oxidoreductase family protein [Cordyceps fumosorosea ARSEF 2679]